MAENIRNVRDLRVYQGAFDAALKIFELTKSFPPEERFSLVDQMRRSSRAVCANLAEAWRKRRYPAHFVSKLSDAEAEADETRVWLEFSFHHRYIDELTFGELDGRYDLILGQLTKMHSEPEKWTIKIKN
jgi:four helix bundle protein